MRLEACRPGFDHDEDEGDDSDINDHGNDDYDEDNDDNDEKMTTIKMTTSTKITWTLTFRNEEGEDSSSFYLSSMHNGTKPGHFEAFKIHFPTSEGVSEVSERTNE